MTTSLLRYFNEDKCIDEVPFDQDQTRLFVKLAYEALEKLAVHEDLTDAEQKLREKLTKLRSEHMELI